MAFRGWLQGAAKVAAGTPWRCVRGSQSSAPGTYCRQGPLPGRRRGAGSVPRGSGAQPAGRSSRHGAGSTCSEKESLAPGETQPGLLSNPSTTGLCIPSCTKAPRSCSGMLSSPVPLSPLSYTEPLLSFPVPPGSESLCASRLRDPSWPSAAIPAVSTACLCLSRAERRGEHCLVSPKTCCCCTGASKLSLRARGPIPSRRCARSGLPPCFPPAPGRMQAGAFREQQACLE